MNSEEFHELLKKVCVWSLYDNHENLGILKNMRNILSDERELVLMVEGEIGEIEGLRSGAINGIAALRRRDLRVSLGRDLGSSSCSPSL